MSDHTAERTQARAGWLFASPALVLITIFVVIPIAASLLLSFTDFDVYAIADLRNARFVGVSNYVALFRNPLFRTAVENTLYFALVGAPLTVAVSLGAALLLNARLTPFRSFFRTVYFVPFVTTLVAASVVWRYLYHPRFGLLDFVLGAFHVAPIDWLGDPHWAMPAIIIMAVWKNFGLGMLICIVGLQRIPVDLYEAAALDGASAWQRFVHVTLPMLRPTLAFVVVVTMIGYFQLFAEPYVMTSGGPLGKTTSIVLLMYEEGFRRWHMGSAAAIAVVLFVVIVAASLLLRRLHGALPCSSNRTRDGEA